MTTMDPAVREVVDALMASARGQMATSTGLERLEDSVKEMKTSIDALVEEMKIANALDEKTGEVQRDVVDKVSALADRMFTAASSRKAMALYAAALWIVLSWAGVSPASIRAFIMTFATDIMNPMGPMAIQPAAQSTPPPSQP